MSVHTYTLYGWMERSCVTKPGHVRSDRLRPTFFHTLFFSSIIPHSCLYSLLAFRSLLLHFLFVSCSDLLRHLLIFSHVFSFFTLFFLLSSDLCFFPPFYFLFFFFFMVPVMAPWSSQLHISLYIDYHYFVVMGPVGICINFPFEML